jgi:hypothetical protein
MVGLLLLLYVSGGISLPVFCLLCWCYASGRGSKRAKRRAKIDAEAALAHTSGEVVPPMGPGVAVVVNV